MALASKSGPLQSDIFEVIMLVHADVRMCRRFSWNRRETALASRSALSSEAFVRHRF